MKTGVIVNASITLPTRVEHQKMKTLILVLTVCLAVYSGQSSAETLADTSHFDLTQTWVGYLLWYFSALPTA